MPDVPEITKGQRYETEWEDFRLVIERRSERWQAFVYDAEKFEILYAANRLTAEAAKLTALDFVLTDRYGPGHGLKSEVVTAMLV